jgi:hypothetical protein
MNLKYKFNASEFSKLLGITTSGVRKRRLSGKLDGQYIKNNSEYFYSAPGRDRPIKETFTSKTIHASQSSARRRHVPDGETNYGKCRNPHKMQQNNDYRSLMRIKGLLTKEEQEKVVPKLIELAKAEVVKEKLSILLSPTFKPFPVVNNLKKLQHYEKHYQEPKGRWYNHDTQEMETNSTIKHVPEYY